MFCRLREQFADWDSIIFQLPDDMGGTPPPPPPTHTHTPPSTNGPMRGSQLSSSYAFDRNLSK